MRLSECEQGKKHRVVKLNTKEETKEFLFNIGLEEGNYITPISKIANSIIVVIKGTRFAIDKKMANLIEVSN